MISTTISHPIRIHKLPILHPIPNKPNHIQINNQHKNSNQPQLCIPINIDIQIMLYIVIASTYIYLVIAGYCESGYLGDASMGMGSGGEVVVCSADSEVFWGWGDLV